MTHANPILVNVFKGSLVESFHRGAGIVLGPGEEVLCAFGNQETLIYPRSTLKPLQALILFTSGAAQKFELTESMLALVCASHVGQSVHVDLGQKFAEQIGVDARQIASGTQVPLDSKSRRELVKAGKKPTVFHHNCIGKHLAFIAAAKALGMDPNGYENSEHPVQVYMRSLLTPILEVDLDALPVSPDGCSVPVYGIPLRALARAYLRLIEGNSKENAYGQEFQILSNAMRFNPEIISGKGHVSTLMMQHYAPDLILKTGAEAVYAGALQTERGVYSFALKIDDGTQRGADLVVTAIIHKLVQKIAPPVDEKGISFLTPPVYSNRNNMIGALQISSEFNTILQKSSFQK